MTREEFTDSVTREQKGLRRFLLALCCGDMSMADDIAQEAFVKAYLSLDKLRDDARFKAWLYRIAHRTFLTYRRSQCFFEDCTAIADTMAATDAGNDYQPLYDALAGLPPKERTAIVLFYMENYSVKEISQVVDCSEVAVRQQLSRARDHLRKLLTTNQ